MDDYSFVRYEKFGRVRDFAEANQADVAATDAPQHLTTLESILGQIDDAKAGQAGGSATPVAVKLDVVRHEVQDIARTARALAQDDPSYNVLFRPSEALNPRAVITAADAILANLIVGPNDDPATKTAKADRLAQFVAKGMPQDFATQLQTDRGAIDLARKNEHNADNSGYEDTAAIGRLVDGGMKECNYLDAIFHNVYAHNPDKLRAWLSASHLERVPHRVQTPPPPPPTTAAGGK